MVLFLDFFVELMIFCYNYYIDIDNLLIINNKEMKKFISNHFGRLALLAFFGFFVIALPVGAQTECQYVAGDANQDGMVSAADMSAIRYYLSTEGAQSNCSMDCNASGNITSGDMFCVRAKITGEQCLFEKGDANQDDVIDMHDIYKLRQLIGADNPTLCGADCDANGTVNILDIRCLNDIVAANCQYKKGDANQDGKVDESDAQAIMNFYYNETGEEKCSMDCNNDGTVTPADVVCVRNELPCTFEAGDANQDKTINNIDMGVIKNYLLKKASSTCSMDCNKDSSINESDMNCVKEKILGVSCLFEAGDANQDKVINVLDMGAIKYYITNKGAKSNCSMDCNLSGDITAADMFCVKAKIIGEECLYERGDANKDGVINADDRAVVDQNINASLSNDNCSMDCNSDKYINFADISCINSKTATKPCGFEFGDANQDKKINIQDMGAIQYYLTHTGAKTNCSMDCNQDGMISGADRSCVKSIMLGSSCQYDAGDANKDGAINVIDLGTVTKNIGVAMTKDNCSMDCNIDGYITSGDLFCVKSKILNGNSCAYEYGDANQDGFISMWDILVIRDNMTAKLGADNCSIDCDNDGHITNTDYFCVRNKILKTTGTYPPAKIGQVATPIFTILSNINTTVFDINKDGFINAADSTWLEEYYAKYMKLYKNKKNIAADSEDFKILDINKDKKIDGNDMAILVKFKQYLTSNFGLRVTDEVSIKTKLMLYDMDLNSDGIVSGLDGEILNHYMKVQTQILKKKKDIFHLEVNYDLTGDGLVTQKDIDKAKALLKDMRKQYADIFDMLLTKERIKAGNPDLNGDMLVNYTDKGVLSQFSKNQMKNKKLTSKSAGWEAGYDLNDDGKIDKGDFDIIKKADALIKKHSAYGKILLTK